MERFIKIRKGIDLKIEGKAKTILEQPNASENPMIYGLCPDDFVGVKPKVVVKEGDKVQVGDALFINKQYQNVKFVSPVAGTVKEIIRGERRKVLCVKVVADAIDNEQLLDSSSSMSNEAKPLTSNIEVVEYLADKGLLGYITQMPYAISANDVDLPKSIFISAFRDMPLSADVDFCIAADLKNFQTGIETLKKIAPVFLNIKKGSKMDCAEMCNHTPENVTVTRFEGKCPTGNVNVQINHIQPINKGDIVWTVEPEVVVFIGRLINTGCVDLRKKVAICGSEVKNPCYKEVVIGQQVSTLLNEKINFSKTQDNRLRIINGNILTGKKSSLEDFLGAHSYEITVIPEGSDNAEMLGWIMPMCFRNRKPVDARIKGGKRHMIMSGEYDKVLPMDIYGEFLIKAIITGDIDKMEQLGIYEVAPEDFALAEYVDSSKLELQRIVREGLDMLRKENA